MLIIALRAGPQTALLRSNAAHYKSVMHKVEIMENILCVLKTYQILIAGIIGFTGVACTMWWNARIQRVQHDRAIKHDRQALRSALKAELTANKGAYEHRIDQFKEPAGDNHALMQNKVQDHVYSTLLEKIGILEPDEIERIVEAYQIIREIPYRIRILTGTDSVGGFQDEYIRLRPEHIDKVQKIHEALLPTVLAAIESISQHSENA